MPGTLQATEWGLTMSLRNCTHQLGWERGAELVVIAAAQIQYFPTPNSP